MPAVDYSALTTTRDLVAMEPECPELRFSAKDGSTFPRLDRAWYEQGTVVYASAATTATRNTGPDGKPYVVKSQRLSFLQENEAGLAAAVTEIDFHKCTGRSSFIPALRDVVQTDDWLHLVFEDGGVPLNKVAAARQGLAAKVKLAGNALKSVTSVLAWLHGSGFVYGDMKVQQLLWNDTEQRVMVCNFASIFDKEVGDIKNFTIDCVPPDVAAAAFRRDGSLDESALARGMDEAYDMYAAGLIVAYIIYGKNPNATSNSEYTAALRRCRGNEDAAEVAALREKLYREPRAYMRHPLWSQLKPEVQALLHGMLHPAAAQRWSWDQVKASEWGRQLWAPAPPRAPPAPASCSPAPAPATPTVAAATSSQKSNSKSSSGCTKIEACAAALPPAAADDDTTADAAALGSQPECAAGGGDVVDKSSPGCTAEVEAPPPAASLSAKINTKMAASVAVQARAPAADFGAQAGAPLAATADAGAQTAAAAAAAAAAAVQTEPAAADLSVLLFLLQDKQAAADCAALRADNAALRQENEALQRELGQLRCAVAALLADRLLQERHGAAGGAGGGLPPKGLARSCSSGSGASGKEAAYEAKVESLAAGCSGGGGGEEEGEEGWTIPAVPAPLDAVALGGGCSNGSSSTEESSSAGASAAGSDYGEGGVGARRCEEEGEVTVTASSCSSVESESEGEGEGEEEEVVEEECCSVSGEEEEVCGGGDGCVVVVGIGARGGSCCTAACSQKEEDMSQEAPAAACVSGCGAGGCGAGPKVKGSGGSLGRRAAHAMAQAVAEAKEEWREFKSHMAQDFKEECGGWKVWRLLRGGKESKESSSNNKCSGGGGGFKVLLGFTPPRVV